MDLNILMIEYHFVYPVTLLIIQFGTIFILGFDEENVYASLIISSFFIFLHCLALAASYPRNLFIASYANGNYEYSKQMKECVINENSSAHVLYCFDKKISLLQEEAELNIIRQNIK